MEKLFSKIEDKNSGEMENNLEKKKWDLVRLQFDYLQKIDSGDLKPLEGEKPSLKDMIRSYTSVGHYIHNAYCNRISVEEYNEKKYSLFEDNITLKILDVYNKDKKNWKDISRKIINEELKKVGEVRDVKSDKDQAGLVDFGLSKNFDLEDFGISKDDDCLSIHFNSLAEQKSLDPEIKNIFSYNSLSKLALRIVDEFPQTKAVIGQSWLVSSPIGKRIGFNIFKELNYVSSSTEFWGQFINEDGSINVARAKKFLETGKPEFPIALGFIKVEDFLKKYLPEDRRGKIELKDTTLDYINFNNSIGETRKKIFDPDNKTTPEQAEVILNENPYIMEFLKTDDGFKFLSLIKETLKRGVQLSDLEYEGKDDILNNFQNYFKKISDNKFITREVVI